MSLHSGQGGTPQTYLLSCLQQCAGMFFLVGSSSVAELMTTPLPYKQPGRCVGTGDNALALCCGWWPPLCLLNSSLRPVAGNSLVCAVHMDDASGRITGVTSRDHDGETTLHEADAVVFAIGISGPVLCLS